MQGKAHTFTSESHNHRRRVYLARLRGKTPCDTKKLSNLAASILVCLFKKRPVNTYEQFPISEGEPTGLRAGQFYLRTAFSAGWESVKDEDPGAGKGKDGVVKGVMTGSTDGDPDGKVGVLVLPTLTVLP